MIYTTPPADFDPAFEAAALYLEHQRRIVVMRRTTDTWFEPGKWGAPAGKLEVGESRVAGALRELREETGLQLTENDLQFFETVYVRHPLGDYPFHTFHAVLANRPALQLSDEHTESRWVTAAEALRLELVLHQDECFERFFAAQGWQ